MLDVRFSLISLALAALLICRTGHGEEIRRESAGEQPAGVATQQGLVSVRSLVHNAYRWAQTAETKSDYDRLLRLCRCLTNTPLSERTKAYVNCLAAWAHNQRGELFAARAAEARQSGHDTGGEALEAQALDDFSEAVRLDPTSWQALHNRAVSLGNMGRLQQAERDFTGTIQLRPDYANASYNRAEMRVQLGRFREADDDYSQAIRLSDDDAESYLGRAHVRLQLGEFEQALADCTKVIQLEPESAAVYVERAGVHAAMGHWELSATDYREAIRLDRHLGRAYQGAAWLMATCPDVRIRNPQLALRAARKAIALQGSEDYVYLDALAAAQASAGQFQQACRSLTRAIQSAPPQATDVLKQRLALYERNQAYRDAPAD